MCIRDSISRGSIFRLPVVSYDTAADLLADLRRCGVAAIATSAAGGTPLIGLSRPSGPLAVLMGNEAEGLPPAVAAAVDICVTCLLYTSPSPRDRTRSSMPSSA